MELCYYAYGSSGYKSKVYRPSIFKGVDVKMVRTSHPIRNRVLLLTAGVIVFLAGACLASFNEDSSATGGGHGNLGLWMLGVCIELIGFVLVAVVALSD